MSAATRDVPLEIEAVAPHHWRVRDPAGSGTWHHVKRDPATGALACDCADATYRRDKRCKHRQGVAALEPPAVRGNGGPGLESGIPWPDASDAGADPGEPARRPRFRLYTCGELEQLPPVTWLIEEHIPLGGFTVLYGAPGSGKSFLSLAWALSVGPGGTGSGTGTWLRWSTSWGPVVYVAAEGGTGIRQRLRAYRDAHAIADEPALYVVREPVNLLEATDALLADVQAALPCQPGLFVFDTLARCLGGGDENGPEAMGSAVLAIDTIRRATGAAVLANHHTGRQGEMPRGHSSLDAAVDSLFLLKDEGGIRLLECKKQRDAEAVPIQRLRLVPHSPSCIIEPAETQPVGLGATDRKLLQTHQEVSQSGETNSTVWLDSAGVSKATFHRSLKRLVDGGHVMKRNRRWALTALGEAECLKGLTEVSRSP